MEGRSFPAVSRGWPIMEVGMQVELILLQYLEEKFGNKNVNKIFFLFSDEEDLSPTEQLSRR
jgi:hypothetical protein